MLTETLAALPKTTALIICLPLMTAGLAAIGTIITGHPIKTSRNKTLSCVLVIIFILSGLATIEVALATAYLPHLLIASQIQSQPATSQPRWIVPNPPKDSSAPIELFQAFGKRLAEPRCPDGWTIVSGADKPICLRRHGL